MKQCKGQGPVRRFAAGGLIGQLDDGDPNRLRLAANPLQNQINPYDQKIALNTALSGLSNTERYQLDNPANAAYKPGALPPGSAAAASQMERQTGILRTVRDNLATQQPERPGLAWMGSGMGNPMQTTLPGAVQPAGYANGGTVETPEQLMARMAAKYGASGAAPAPVPAPAPAPTQAIVQEPQQRGILSLLKNRGAQIDKAVNGYANGGKIQGPGTPTSDSIPGEIRETGDPIQVSTGERIVSAKQEKVLQKIAQGMGFKTLDALLEHGTGRPVGPTIKHGKAHAANGKIPNPQDYEWRDFGSKSEINKTPSQLDNGGGLIGRLVSSVPAEEKAALSRRADSYMQSKGIPAQTPNTPSPDVIETGAQERTFGAQGAASASPVAPSDTQASAPSPVGSITMGGKTRSLASLPAGADGYIDANGKPVAKWEDTARYAEQMQVNDRMSKLARQMERDRYGRDMQADITSPRVQTLALANLDRMNKEDAQANALQTAEMDRQIKGQTLAANAIENQFAQRLNDPELTPDQRLALRSDMLAFKGKNPNEHRYLRGDNVKQYNEMGQVIGELPGGWFDTATQQVVGGQNKAGVTTKEEVSRAIATGKISKEQAAERIRKAGGNPKDYGL